MKRIFSYIAIMLAGITFVSCQKDNYQQPGSSFTGRIVYQGEPLHFKRNAMSFELWEDGWAKRTAINVSVDQDGNFSSKIFDADYKMIIPINRGPFRNIANTETGSDTILVNLHGQSNMDIEVMPYYIIKNVALSASGRTVVANFGLEKIITDANAKNVEKVTLYVSKTHFVDNDTEIKNMSPTVKSGSAIADYNNISLTGTVPAMSPDQSYVYARVAVKVAGISNELFSAEQKLDIQ